RGPSHGQRLHPLASTTSPGGVPAHASLASGTPSPSLSPPGTAGSVVLVLGATVAVEVVVVLGVVVTVELLTGATVVDVLDEALAVVAVELVVVVLVGMVVVVVVVVVEAGTAARQEAAPTLCPMRALTTSPNTRSMLESPPASRWQ